MLRDALGESLLYGEIGRLLFEIGVQQQWFVGCQLPERGEEQEVPVFHFDSRFDIKVAVDAAFPMLRA